MSPKHDHVPYRLRSATPYDPSLIDRRLIRLGTGPRTVSDFRKDLNKQGIVIDPCAEHVMGKLAITVSSHESEVCAGIVSVSELGFTEISFRNIFPKAKERLALKPGLAEWNLQFLLQITDQLKHDFLIGMDPVMDGHRQPKVLYTHKASTGVRHLTAVCASPDRVFGHNARIVLWF